jgi:hypothetical protein
MPTLWTQEMRRKMYSRLSKEIAPHQNWDAKIKPIWKKQQYAQILSELADEFSLEASAIQQQINFATTTQAELKNRSHIRTFILNKAAAIEVGFIATPELPNYLKISN